MTSYYKVRSNVSNYVGTLIGTSNVNQYVNLFTKTIEYLLNKLDNPTIINNAKSRLKIFMRRQNKLICIKRMSIVCL